MATHVDVDEATGQCQSSAARAGKGKGRKRKRKAEQGAGESVSTAQDVTVTEGGPSKKVYSYSETSLFSSPLGQESVPNREVPSFQRSKLHNPKVCVPT